MAIKKFTPILIVDSVESTLPFWEEQLHYEVAMTVPHHETIGFAILKQGESEVMLQSRASLAEDLPAIVNKCSTQTVMLYADVDSLEEIENSLGNVEVLVPRRRTSYGSQEIWIKENSGAIIGFAELEH